ncbi:GrpE, mitochondrial [Polyrhizophydium stewartii]|uniref:GrpE protein homolog n=1 Tax=Polyrhizophydium stewartii TaxID=2732419 RepID=A0ABR4N0K1_9FUNG|nr:GrpE protein, mitochondrial [Polyrhizophydium stewartii]
MRWYSADAKQDGASDAAKPAAGGEEANNTKADAKAADAGAGAGAADAAKALKKTLEEKDKQISHLQGLYRRALADAENLRQRTRKEIEDKQTFAIQKFAKELLNTADILAMALDAVPEAERAGASSNAHLKNLYTGVSMTRAELLKTFKQFGVEAYNPINEKFDHNLHQALFQAPMPGKEPGTVFQVTKVGYKIHDRVLRPAQVGVVRED